MESLSASEAEVTPKLACTGLKQLPLNAPTGLTLLQITIHTGTFRPSFLAVTSHLRLSLITDMALIPPIACVIARDKLTDANHTPLLLAAARWQPNSSFICIFMSYVAYVNAT